MNKVILLGRLTKEPEIKESGDKKWAKFTLAVDRRTKERETDFLNIVAFGKSAEFSEKYLKKGTKILLTGRIQTGSYTNKDNQKVYTTDVVAEEIEFAESKSSETKTESESSDGDFMNITQEQKDDMPF